MVGPAVLYLPLSEVQVDGDLVAAKPGQVVVVRKLRLQLPQLLLGEGCALFAGFAAGVYLEAGLLEVCEETKAKQVDLCVTQKASTHLKPTPALNRRL